MLFLHRKELAAIAVLLTCIALPSTNSSAASTQDMIDFITSFFSGESENIRQAVEAYTETQPGVCLVYGRWPFTAPLGSFRLTRDQSQALARNGIANTSGGVYQQKGELTDLAKEHYYYPNIRNPSPYASIFGTGYGGLCAGSREFIAVDEYTTPASVGGVLTTRVRYRYRISMMEGWIHNDDISAAFPDTAEQLGKTEIIVTGMFVSTSNGWRASE